jgi:hypothetical protein
MPESGYCYAYVSTTATHANSAVGCAARGMQLVRYLTAEMQLEAESRVVPASDYWIGLSFTSSAWRWLDGTELGSGIVPSNANPYAHWARAANTTAGAGTTAACVMAQSTSAYGVYTGDGSTLQQTSAYYTTTAANKTNGWLPAACSGLKAYLCYGAAATLYQCPPAPPPLSPSPPLMPIASLCECALFACCTYARSMLHSWPRQCHDTMHMRNCTAAVAHPHPHPPALTLTLTIRMGQQEHRVVCTTHSRV